MRPNTSWRLAHSKKHRDLVECGISLEPEKDEEKLVFGRTESRGSTSPERAVLLQSSSQRRTRLFGLVPFFFESRGHRVEFFDWEARDRFDGPVGAKFMFHDFDLSGYLINSRDSHNPSFLPPEPPFARDEGGGADGFGLQAKNIRSRALFFVRNVLSALEDGKLKTDLHENVISTLKTAGKHIVKINAKRTNRTKVKSEKQVKMFSRN